MRFTSFDLTSLSAGRWLGKDTELSKMFAAQEEKDNCEDELRVSLHKAFLSLPIEERTALKAAVQLNKDSLEKVLTLSWEIIAAKLQDKFTNFVPKRRVSLQGNDRYKEISLSSVILLQKNHPSLGFRPSHPAYATIGCNRLRKFHKILDKGANILLRIPSAQ